MLQRPAVVEPRFDKPRPASGDVRVESLVVARLERSAAGRVGGQGGSIWPLMSGRAVLEAVP